MKYYLVLFGFAIVSGCTLLDVKVNVVSERTSLENQVLGSYHSLDQEMLLLSSVRGIDPKGRIKTPQPASQDKKDVIAAMQVIDFYADDIRLFKASGWLGENNRGLLAFFPMEKNKLSEALKREVSRYSDAEFKSITETVNQSRKAVMQRVIDMNPNLSERDMPEIEKVFGKLNVENAKDGERIQLPEGAWKTK